MTTSGQSTFGELLDELARLVGRGGKRTDDYRTTLKWAMNRAAADVWNHQLWTERVRPTRFTTAGQYTTGTITLTQGSRDVVGVGTTFTAEMVGRLLALSTSGVPYQVASFTDATHISLDREYAETTAPGSAFTIYAGEYDLDESVETVQSVHLLAAFGGMTEMEELDITRSGGVPAAVGDPNSWAIVSSLEADPNVRRLRLWPVPSRVLTVEVRGATFWDNMVDEDETPKFHRDKEQVVVLGASLFLQRSGGGQSITSYPEISVMLQNLWAKTKPRRPWSGRRKTFDAPRGGSRSPFGPAREA